VLRLMPAGVVYILVAGLAFRLAGGRIGLAGWLAALLYGANYYDLWAGYRSTLAGVRHPFNILWSLAIEEHFYAVWPALLAPLWRLRWALAAVLALCAAILLWRFWLLHACLGAGAPLVCGPPNPNPLWRYNRLYLAADTRLDSIAWGAVLALLQQRGRLPSRWLALPGLALLALSFVGSGPLARHVLRPSLQGLALLGLVPPLLAGEGWIGRILCAGPMLIVGRFSYSLYLWHWGALAAADFAAQRWGAARGGAAWLAVAIILSVALSLASYGGIERPMLRLRRRFGSRVPLAVMLVGVAQEPGSVPQAETSTTKGARHAAG
jgi:peptidoglycan/LPS O-acetylase OafA/YrhL